MRTPGSDIGPRSDRAPQTSAPVVQWLGIALLASCVENRRINVNSGVVGLCKHRDWELLSAWCWASQWLAMNPGLQPLSAWADQGLLLWALHHTACTSMIQSDLRYNQPVFTESNLLLGSIRKGHGLLSEFRHVFPDSTILHFLGPHKLSRQLDDQIQQIFFEEQLDRTSASTLGSE